MVSLVIPAYNEKRRLGSSLEKLKSFVKIFQKELEVIVVNDGSTDETAKIAAGFSSSLPNLRVLTTIHKGKGFAVNQGFLESKGDIVVFTDADFSTPIEEINKLLKAIEEGYDITIGSRALNRGLIKHHQNLIRETMGRMFNLLVRLIAVRGIVDTQCGFKAFKKSSCGQIFAQQRVWDFGFDVELLFLAQKQGLTIDEIPVLWYNDERSSVNPIVDSVKMLFDLLKIRLLHV